MYSRKPIYQTMVSTACGAGIDRYSRGMRVCHKARRVANTLPMRCAQWTGTRDKGTMPEWSHTLPQRESVTKKALHTRAYGIVRRAWSRPVWSQAAYRGLNVLVSRDDRQSSVSSQNLILYTELKAPFRVARTHPGVLLYMVVK